MIKAANIREETRKFGRNAMSFAKRRLSGMDRKSMPKRDITGVCEGECRNRVKEGEEERQNAIRTENIESPEDYPRAQWAKKRNNPPGELGGHV